MSTTAAGVPSHARKDREGPAKAGQVDRGSGARSPATTKPGEDNEVWPRPTRQEDASTAPGTRCDLPRQEDASTAPGADALQHRTAPGATRQERRATHDRGAGAPRARPSGPKPGPVGPDRARAAARAAAWRTPRRGHQPRQGAPRSLDGGRPEDRDQAQAGSDRARAGQSSACPASRPPAR
jgi:hypothetical protein